MQAPRKKRKPKRRAFGPVNESNLSQKHLRTTGDLDDSFYQFFFFASLGSIIPGFRPRHDTNVRAEQHTGPRVRQDIVPYNFSIQDMILMLENEGNDHVA